MNAGKRWADILILVAEGEEGRSGKVELANFLMRTGAGKDVSKLQMHRCPGCHSEFDHDSSIDDVVAKEVNHRTRGRSCRNGCRFSASLPMRSLLAAIASRKRKEQSDGAGNTATTTVHCSMDNIEESDRLDDAHVDATAGRRKEQLDDDVIVDKNSYRAKIDPSPFAFTYETETVEPYQVHGSQDESITQVETYQLEWLLFDV
jgi:hypothetical protein